MDAEQSQSLTHELPPPQLEGWQLASEPQSEGFTIARAPGWRAGQYRQAARRLLTGLLFLALSVVSLRSGLATPNPGLLLPEPALLPALALLVGAVFVLQAGVGALRARRAPIQFRVLLGEPFLLQWRHDEQAPWEGVAAEAQAVVVSERLNRRGKNTEASWGALHIWLAEGSLRDILSVGKQTLPSDGPAGSGESDLQRVGQLLARVLSLPYHYLSQPTRASATREDQAALYGGEASVPITPVPAPPKTTPTG